MHLVSHDYTLFFRKNIDKLFFSIAWFFFIYREAELLVRTQPYDSILHMREFGANTVQPIDSINLDGAPHFHPNFIIG